MQIPTQYKKIGLISAFLITVAILAFMIFNVFFRVAVEPDPDSPDGMSGTSTTGRLPVSGPGSDPEGAQEKSESEEADSRQSPRLLPSEIAAGGLTETKSVGNGIAAGMTKTPDGSGVRYYNELDGKFYESGEDGNATALSDKIFHDISEITWSPSGEKAVIEYPDSAKIVYDFQTGRQSTLPKHWDDINFSPDSDRLVLKSVGLDPNNRWLAVSNDDGAGARTLASLGEYGDTVIPSWSPNNQSVAMYTESAGFDRQYVYFMGLNNENFKSLTVEGRGFEPLWNPSGEYLLYSVYSSESNLKPELWTTRADGENIGQERKRLGIETWARKCAFADNSTAYCAVPETLEEGAGMVPELSSGSKDELYKIDILTGQKSLVAIPDGSFSISSLTISKSGGDLYFTDGPTKKIRRIRLK
jgi:WD40 repeat protein